MGDKYVVVALFCVVGFFLTLILPIWKRKLLFTASTNKTPYRIASEEPPWVNRCLILAVITLGFFLHNKLPWTYLVSALLISMLGALLANEQRGMTAVSILSGLLVITVLPWWLRSAGVGLSIDDKQILYVSVTISLILGFLQKNHLLQSENYFHLRISSPVIYGVFAAAVAYVVMVIGLSFAIGDFTTWHHWGAYIGPAQLINAGALPLRDIPLQYGLGPTLILSVGCRVDCWAAMYWLSALTTIALTYLLAFVALKLTSSRHPLTVLLTLSTIAVSCLLWTAYPPSLMGVLTMPSTTGLRFLPGVLMLSFALELSRKGYCLKKFAKWGNVLWFGCILWSPEAALHATVVWAPYLIWTRAFQNDGQFDIHECLKAVLELITTLIVGGVLFQLVYYFAYGERPYLAEYLTYLINPPGAMPINPRGAIWFAVCCLVCWFLGVFVVNRATWDTHRLRSSWLVALLCIANFTYYLGRSHDNNILNLMPYLTLLLIVTRELAYGSIRILATTLLSAVLGLVALFGWSGLVNVAVQNDSTPLSLTFLSESFNRETNYVFNYRFPSADLKPTDAKPLLEHIRNNFRESVVVLDNYLLLNSGEPYPYWSALQVPTNFILLDSNLRRIYLSRVAQRLNRSGWVIYTKDYESYLRDYETVYNKVEEFQIGLYTAIRYVPK